MHRYSPPQAPRQLSPLSPKMSPQSPKRSPGSKATSPSKPRSEAGLPPRYVRHALRRTSTLPEDVVSTAVSPPAKLPPRARRRSSIKDAEKKHSSWHFAFFDWPDSGHDWAEQNERSPQGEDVQSPTSPQRCEFSRSPCGVFRSMSRCLSAENEVVESDPSSPEFQEASSKRRRSSLLLGMLSTRRKSKQESATTEKPLLEYMREKLVAYWSGHSPEQAASPQSADASPDSVNDAPARKRRRSASECFENTFLKRGPKGGTDRRPPHDGNRRCHSGSTDNIWKAAEEDNWGDGLTPREAFKAGRARSSRQRIWPGSRFVIPNHGRPFPTRARRWTSRMNGAPRLGGYLPIRPYWPPYHYRYRGALRQHFPLRCTCYRPARFQIRPPPFSPCFPTAAWGTSWSTFQGHAGQQATPCKACETVHHRATSQSRERGLRERIRAEEKIKRIEDEMSIHERSRREQLVFKEEIKEAEETARLERELLIGELWCRNTGRDDLYVLEADTSGRAGAHVKALCRVLEERRPNDGRAAVSGTAFDETTDLILGPNDTMSQLLLMERAPESQQREETAAYDDMVVSTRPVWYRARCSAGDIQDFDREISIDSYAPSPTAKEQVKRGGIFAAAVQEKTTPHHSGLDISFAKEFAWQSEFVLSPSESSYGQEVTRSVEEEHRRSASSSIHSLRSSKRESSMARSRRHRTQRKRNHDAHSDKHVAKASQSVDHEKFTTSKTREHRRTSTLTSSHASQGGGVKSANLKRAKSKALEEVAGAEGLTAHKKSTVLLASSIDDSKCVARETGEPVHHDDQTATEAIIAKSSSLAPSSGALSSGLYATAAEGPATQSTKSEVLAETVKPKDGGNDVVPPTDAATQVGTKQEDQHGGAAIFSDPAVASKLASPSPDLENVGANSHFGLAARDSESRQRLRSPPPPVQIRYVRSPPVPVPAAVFSGHSLLLMVACLLILWFTIVFVTAAVTRNGHTTRETTELTSHSVSTTDRSKPPGLSGVYLCKTEQCLREGAYLNSLLGGGTAPCTNFYEYVCGRWFPERTGNNSSPTQLWSRDTILEAQMEIKSVQFFTSSPDDVRPVQALLQACNDRPLASSAMVELRKLFQQWQIDEWPLPPYATRSREDVWVLAGDLLRDLGVAALVDVFPARYPSDGRPALIAVDLPEPLYFPRGDVAETQLVRAAVKEALHFFDVLNALDIDRFANEVVRVFDALQTLYQSVIPEEAEVMHLSEIDVGFHKLISRAVGGNKTNAIYLEGDARVLLLDSRFVKALPNSLGLLSPQAILNHLVFRALVRLAAFLPDSLSSLRRLSYLESTGRYEKPEALSLCLRTLERAAPSCFLSALAQPPSSTAALRRHWLSDLEIALLRALPRLRWLDALSSTVVAERIRLLHTDASFIGNPKSDAPCAANEVRVLRTPIAALVEVFRRRPLHSLTSWRRRALPLTTWPSLDLPSGPLVRVPPGLINDSVPANGSLLFAFHLARVAVRLYAAMMPILHVRSLYDHTMPLTEASERNSRDLLACMSLGEWHQWAAPVGSNREHWLRRWLLDQTLAIELSLLSFRELSAAGRVWKLDPRFANLADVTSTQLFFVYYALDHCERRGTEEAADDYVRRELLLRQRLPSAAMVNLPLLNMPTFTDAFGCIPGDYLATKLSCQIL